MAYRADLGNRQTSLGFLGSNPAVPAYHYRTPRKETVIDKPSMSVALNYSGEDEAGGCRVSVLCISGCWWSHGIFEGQYYGGCIGVVSSRPEGM